MPTPRPGRSTPQNVASLAGRAAPGLLGGSRAGLAPIADRLPTRRQREADLRWVYTELGGGEFFTAYSQGQTITSGAGSSFILWHAESTSFGVVEEGDDNVFTKKPGLYNLWWTVSIPKSAVGTDPVYWQLTTPDADTINGDVPLSPGDGSSRLWRGDMTLPQIIDTPDGAGRMGSFIFQLWCPTADFDLDEFGATLRLHHLIAV